MRKWVKSRAPTPTRSSCSISREALEARTKVAALVRQREVEQFAMLFQRQNLLDLLANRLKGKKEEIIKEKSPHLASATRCKRWREKGVRECYVVSCTAVLL